MIEVMKRKLRGNMKFGILTYNSLDGKENIKSHGLVINEKIVCIAAICEEYWFIGESKKKVNFKLDKKGLIIGKLNIKIYTKKIKF